MPRLRDDGGPRRLVHYDRFKAPDDLRAWFAEATLRIAGVDVNDDELRAAGDLRDAIQHIAFSLLASGSPAAEHIAAVNPFAAAPPLARTLDPKTLTVVISTPASARSLLSEIARDALDLVADPRARARIRECESPDCQLLFYDHSRPGKRRWCSPSRCGDRARSRAYRARKTQR